MSYKVRIPRRHTIQLHEDTGNDWVPWKKWRWLERHAKRLWERWSTPHMQSVQTVGFGEREFESIREAIGQQRGAIERIWNGEVRHIVLGYDWFRRLVIEATEAWGLCGFHLDMDLANGRERRVYGLQIHLIPWFEGMLILPDWKGGK